MCKNKKKHKLVSHNVKLLTISYAIEKFDKVKRRYYLDQGVTMGVKRGDEEKKLRRRILLQKKMKTFFME